MKIGDEKVHKWLMCFILLAVIVFWWALIRVIVNHVRHEKFDRNSCDLEAVVCKEELGEGGDFNNEDSGYYPALDTHEVWPDDHIR